jgi:hypothetical protein
MLVLCMAINEPSRAEPSSSFFGPARIFFSVFELGLGAQKFLEVLYEARLIKGF